MRIALVTGGASGLGLATAKQFAEDGMAVVVTDLSEAAAKEVARALPGPGHVGLRMDVADENTVFAAFESVECELGPVAVLANFAGVMGEGANGQRVKLMDTSVAEWERVFAINALGSFLCIREMVRRREAKPIEHCRIIMVASAAAQVGSARAPVSYCASKGAVLSLAKSAARELAPLGITVNTIAPGGIDTPMLRLIPGAPKEGEEWPEFSGTPLGRVGEPEEIAAAASYLASKAAAYVTGSTLDVNGGLRMQ